MPEYEGFNSKSNFYFNFYVFRFKLKGWRKKIKLIQKILQILLKLENSMLFVKIIE